MSFLYQTTEQGVLITGYDGEITHLQIPKELAGRPVTGIARSAFARRNDLVYVKLPSTLRRLERLAFSSCANLERVVLHDSITDYYGDIFRLCGGLREIELDLSGERFTVLRELLTDNDRTLFVRVHLPRGEARLIFPEYLEEFQEDTRARAIHSSFAGMGYIYRECVSRTGIDFHGFDLLFDRFSRVDEAIASNMALERLCAPLDLRPDAERRYKNFLQEHSESILPEVIRKNREDWLRMLTEQNLLNSAARQTGLRLAAQSGQNALVALLMREGNRSGQEGRMVL